MTDRGCRLVRGVGNVRAVDRPTVVTIGNFDGVHPGHQFVLDQTVAEARRHDAQSCAMTFEPTPQEFFLGERAPARLTTVVEKYAQIAAHGVDLHVVLRFGRALASMPPADFVSRLLVDGLGARAVIIGHDFRFGKDRRGDFDFLTRAGLAHGFETIEIEARMHGDVRFSSTAVREALTQDDFAAAAELLGRPFTMSGKVIRGEQLGRDLGFPTINIRPRRRVLPIEGIFAVRVSGSGPDGPLHDHPGVASLGTRPTVGGAGHLLEVHLFDFQGNLYGQRLAVEFVAKLRDEAHFESVETMTRQMHLDAEQARAALAESGRPS